MIYNEFRYNHISGSDGLKLSVLRIEPAGNRSIKGIVQIAHGMCEHKERYVEFMKYLAEKGYITVINDHRGHGESVKSKNDLGYMYEGGYKALVDDIHEITLETKKYAEKELGLEKIPYILLGHSMGSMIVRCYIKKYDDEIDRLLVMGCPVEAKGTKIGLLLLKAIEMIKGDKGHSKMLDYLVMDSRYKKKFESEGPAAWLSSNPEVWRKVQVDPLCGFHFTVNGYRNLFKLLMWTYSDGEYTMKNPGLKIKFLSGKDDPCAESKAALGKAMKLIKKQGYKNVSGKMYKGMRHELLNERENIRVYKDILEFIG